MRHNDSVFDILLATFQIRARNFSVTRINELQQKKSQLILVLLYMHFLFETTP